MSRGADPYGRARLRRALMHFLTGRLLSSVLGIVNLVAVIRLLPTHEFGLYAALLSMQVVFLAASSFGIESTMERYLPEVRLRGGHAAVQPFVLRALGLRLAGLLISAVLFTAALPMTLPWLGLAEREGLVSLYVWVIVAVALMNSAGAALEALLHQPAAQAAGILYAGVRAVLIAWGAYDGNLTVAEVVRLDLYAALAAFALALSALLLYARHDANTKVSDGPEPIWRRFAGFAGRNFAGQILLQASGNHVMRLALTSWSGLLETARYGFATSLAELMLRYLPATLLMRLIRPVFISRYIENRDFAQLNAFANIVLKLNMLMLAPAIAFVLAAGDLLVGSVSGGRYADAQWLLLGVLTLLGPFSHQAVISIVAGTLEENDIQIYAALAALAALPVAALSIPELGAYGALLAAIVGAAIYNAMAAWLLRRRGFDYRIDLGGLGRLLLASAVAAAVCWAALVGLRLLPWPRTALLAAALTICVIAFVACAARVRAFTPAERKTIHGMVPRRAFPF
jgi:O-antigen/teichoic acid export membrane protein